MNLDASTWKLAGNMVSAQFSCAVKGFPMPGPLPMAMLRKVGDQSMIVLQGSAEEQDARLAAECAEFAPHAWVRARTEAAAAPAENALVIELHEGNTTRELRLPYRGALNLVPGHAGLPEEEALAAFREGFIDGYGHELRGGEAAALFDDDWVAGREVVVRKLGDHIYRNGSKLMRDISNTKVEAIDLSRITVTAEERRFVGIGLFLLFIDAGALASAWTCGGTVGLAIAALPALFIVFVALRAFMARPHLLIDTGDLRVWWAVRGADIAQAEAFVAELDESTR